MKYLTSQHEREKNPFPYHDSIEAQTLTEWPEKKMDKSPKSFKKFRKDYFFEENVGPG